MKIKYLLIAVSLIALFILFTNKTESAETAQAPAVDPTLPPIILTFDARMTIRALTPAVQSTSLSPSSIDWPTPEADATRMPQATLDYILKHHTTQYPDDPQVEVPTITPTPRPMFLAPTRPIVVPTLVPLPPPKRASTKCRWVWWC